MIDDTEILVRSIRGTVLQVPLPAWPGGWKGEAEAAVIDAVCSIQARYGGPSTGVRRHINDWRRHRNHLAMDDLRFLTDFPMWNAHRDRPLNSRTAGRLKADVIAEVAERFAHHGITTSKHLLEHDQAESIWRSTRGLGYATWRYVLLLLGTDTVKPDSLLTRFVSGALERTVAPTEVSELVTAAARRIEIPSHVLDHAIWQFERNRPTRRADGGGSHPGLSGPVPENS